MKICVQDGICVVSNTLVDKSPLLAPWRDWQSTSRRDVGYNTRSCDDKEEAVPLLQPYVSVTDVEMADSFYKDVSKDTTASLAGVVYEKQVEDIIARVVGGDIDRACVQLLLGRYLGLYQLQDTAAKFVASCLTTQNVQELSIVQCLSGMSENGRVQRETAARAVS